ncbi:MAG: hypothetical protein ACLQMH_02555 [Solirubrobacteraceae bacterium]
MTQAWKSLKLKKTVLLWSSDTVPAPPPSVCRNTGTIAVALVLLLTVAVVVTVVKISELGSLHSAVVVDP